uniref:Uncharacterized protein n=1 Tax=Trichogramma kaykai TaxID=54128 RepID=A0ABD2XSQ0_9HYME
MSGLFTYAGVYAESVMNQAARYLEHRQPLHSHIYVSAKESEVHYGLRHLSHSVVAVSLLHEALKYAQGDGSLEYQVFRQRVSDCLAYTPLQYGQGLNISPPCPRFCDMLDQALPIAENMEASIVSTSRNVNNYGFIDTHILSPRNNEEENTSNTSDKSRKLSPEASPKRATFVNPKSKELISDDESDTDANSTKSDGNGDPKTQANKSKDESSDEDSFTSK